MPVTMIRRFLVVCAFLAVAACKEKRSIGGVPSISSGLSAIGSLISPKEQTQLNKYPLWKIHKYTGIQLKPVTYEQLESTLPAGHGIINEDGFIEIEGHPPKNFQVPTFVTEPYSSEPYPASNRNIQAALDAVDALGGFANLLPNQGGSTRTGRSTEASDRVGILKAPIKLKKKGLLTLLALKKYPKTKFGGGGGVSGGLGGISGGVGSLPGFSGSLQSLYNLINPVKDESPLPGYTTVYRTPTSSNGFFQGLSLGGGGHEGIPVDLPEPSLPEIPQFELVPEIPKIPQLTLNGNYKLPYSTGSYVSIKVPKPLSVTAVPAPVFTAPALEYGPPALEYGLPAQEYGLPAQEYGLPPKEYELPLQEYGVPAQVYGPPAQVYGPPAPVYGPPAVEYGTPVVPTNEYGHSSIDTKAPLEVYGTPTSTFNTASHQLHSSGSYESYLPSSPVPPVYNFNQNQLSSYQTPLYSHSLDGSSYSGTYSAPSPPAIHSIGYHSVPQDYSYDSFHSPSELESTVLVARNSSVSHEENNDESRERQNQVQVIVADLNEAKPEEAKRETTQST